MRDAFELQLHVPEPATVVWGRLIDLDAHTAAIPLTTVVPANHHMAEGLRFVGETRMGPVTIHDRMRVERADPPSEQHPGHLVVQKSGPMAGQVEATVEQVPTGTLLVWRQSVRPAWLPTALRPLGALIAKWAYGIGVRRIVGQQ